MFKNIKQILHTQIKKMKTFDKKSNQIHTITFDINKKVSDSSLRINEIKNSIQNTKQ